MVGLMRASPSMLSFHSLNSRGSRRANGKDGRQRKFNLNEVIESAFGLIVGEYGTKANLEIPIGFYDMYKSSLMRNFLASAIFYFYSYIRVMRLAQQHRDAVTDGHEALMQRDQPIDFDANAELCAARSEQKERLECMSRSYARLLLACSNFEHTYDDVLLFECIYQFVFLVLKASVDPAPFAPRELWNRIQGELCYVFRGPNFDIESKRALKLEMENKAKEIERLKKEDALGSATSSFRPPELVSGNDDLNAHSSNSNSRSWSRSSKANISIRKSVGNYSLNSEQPKPDTPLILPDNKFLGIASLNPIQPEPPQTRAFSGNRMSPRAGRSLREAELALLGHDNLSLRARDQKKAFSVHKAIHARSPILSIILPDPLERTRLNAQAALVQSNSNRKRRRRPSKNSDVSASENPNTFGTSSLGDLDHETQKLLEELSRRRDA